MIHARATEVEVINYRDYAIMLPSAIGRVVISAAATLKARMSFINRSAVVDWNKELPRACVAQMSRSPPFSVADRQQSLERPHSHRNFGKSLGVGVSLIAYILLS
jgi:hypothetical protein